jgi:hypothetical protein
VSGLAVVEICWAATDSWKEARIVRRWLSPCSISPWSCRATLLPGHVRAIRCSRGCLSGLGGVSCLFAGKDEADCHRSIVRGRDLREAE